MSDSMVISTVDDITLVTLAGFPAKVETLAKVFDTISQYDINIDVISMAPTQSAYTGLSFTIADSDSIAPTERSIPPMMITNVIPTAAIPVTDDTRRMFTRFRSARKRSGASALNSANTNTSAQNGNSCLL